jgi:hypothetical protein
LRFLLIPSSGRLVLIAIDDDVYPDRVNHLGIARFVRDNVWEPSTSTWPAEISILNGSFTSDVIVVQFGSDLGCNERYYDRSVTDGQRNRGLSNTLERIQLGYVRPTSTAPNYQTSLSICAKIGLETAYQRFPDTRALDDVNRMHKRCGRGCKRDKKCRHQTEAKRAMN